MDALSKNEMIMLESAHQFCLKYMQGFHKRTKTDRVYAMLGFLKKTPMNERKLLFLHRFCSISLQGAVQNNYSHTECMSVNSRFIPDIISILSKYVLLDYLKTFLASGFFHKKSVDNNRAVAWAKSLGGQRKVTWQISICIHVICMHVCDDDDDDDDDDDIYGPE